MDSPACRVVIIAAEFNKPLIDGMVSAAENELQQAHAELLQTIRVPGSYEVPLMAEISLGVEAVDAVIVLGYIERGETLHGEVMGHVVHSALVDMQIRHRKPIGIGIIGPGATNEQAQQRQVRAALAAVRAALRSCELLRQHCASVFPRHGSPPRAGDDPG
jgi:6,7-dimethyl-8-ribityllumazine synthase